MDEDDASWAMAASVAAVGAATLARKVLVKSWTRKTGRAPGGALGDSTWGEALTWAVVSGVVVGVVRVVAERGVASVLRDDPAGEGPAGELS